MFRTLLFSLLLWVSWVPTASAQDQQAEPPRAEDNAAAAQPSAVHSEAPVPSGARPPAPAATPTVLVVALVLALLALVGGLGGFAFYFWYLLPRKRRKPLLEALALIADPAASDEDLERAEGLVNQALTAGLSKDDIAAARFALAWIRAKLERYADALAIISDLRASGVEDRETLYLDLWLHAQLEHHQEIEDLLAQHPELLEEDHRQARLAAGMTWLHQARILWDRRKIEGASEYYDRMRRYEVLIEHIPDHIDNHRLALGLMALYDKNVEEARAQLSGAHGAERSVSIRIALLLCDWLENDHPQIDEELGELLVELEGERGVEAEAPDVETSESSDGLDEDERLFRNMRLWFAISRLYTWLRLEAKRGLPASEQAELGQRLRAVSELDPSMADPYLIEGLIQYYFAQEDAERDAALELLKKARTKGARVGEVNALVDRLTRLAEMERQAVKGFLDLAKKYLRDRNVPEELRKELLAELQKFTRFQELGEIEVLTTQDSAAPTISELQSRSTMLRRRVQRLLRRRLAHGGGEEKKIGELLTTLGKSSEELKKTSEELERNEQKLMLRSGEFLLEEDEGAEDAQRESEDSKAELAPAFVPEPPPRPVNIKRSSNDE